jgi:hypothetical protein
MNGKGVMKKTSRTVNIELSVRNVLTPVKPWECKTIYSTIKTVHLAMGLLTTNKHDDHAGWVKCPTSPYDKFVSGISMITLFPPCKRKSQLSLSLLFPILIIRFSLVYSLLSLTCEQGAKSVDWWKLALYPALFLYTTRFLFLVFIPGNNSYTLLGCGCYSPLCSLWPLWLKNRIR